MYDKKKTIKGYMGGGYMKPMGYQTGGYIPGLSRARYLTGLDRDMRIAQKEFEANAEKVAKEQKYRGLLGKIGSFAGTALGAALAAPTGGVSVIAGKALGSAIGKGAGELVGGSFVDTENLKKSSTGLYKDDFEYLEKQGREAQDLGGLAERSAIAGATTYGIGKAAEVGGNIKNYFDGTKLDLGEIASEDLLTKDGLARATGIGGDSYAERVTTKGLLDNLDSLDPYTGLIGDEDWITMTMEEQANEKLLEKIAANVLPKPSQVENAQLGFGLTESAEMYNDGGYVQGYEDGGMAKEKRGMGYFNREFPKDSFKAMIQEAVYKGELDPREGLQHILNKQQKDFMKSKDDTSNALYKRLQEAGYSKGGKIEEYGHGGLIDMNPFSRRIL